MLENMHRIQERMDQLRKDCQAMHHHRHRVSSRTFDAQLNKAENKAAPATEKTFASSPDTKVGGNTDYSSIIKKYAKKNGVNANLVKQLIRVASGNNPNLTGKNGEIGLMQLKPEIFRSFGYTDPYNPEQNISAGTQHLSNMLQKNGGNVPLALAAYKTNSSTVGQFGGIPPFLDTQNFVNNIISRIGKDSNEE